MMQPLVERASRTWTRIAGALVLLLLAVPDLGAQVDVAFVVDTATNMSSQDADDARLATVQGILELTRDRGPQRVSVLRVAGRGDLGAGGAEVLAPLALSGDPAADQALVEQQVRPAISGLGADGTAKEIRYTLQHLADRMAGPWGEGAAGPLWIVLLSDGLEDALDTNSRTEAEDVEVRARELAKAENPDVPDDFLNVLRDHYQQASRELLLEQVPGMLQAMEQQRGDQVLLTIVNIDPAGNRQPLLDQLAAATGGQPVIELDGEGRVSGAAQEAVDQSPFPPRSRSGQLVHDGEEGPKGLHLYQGTRSARILIVADHPNFEVSLTGPDGSAGSATEVGSGSAIRSLEMLTSPPAHGDYQLTLTNTGEAPLNARSELFFDLDLALDVTPPAGDSVMLGEPLVLGAGLRDFRGDPVTDALLLEGGRMEVRWSAPGGVGQDESWTPVVSAGGTSHEFAYLPADASDMAQSFGWELSAAVLPGPDGFAWSDRQDGNLSVVVRQPGVHIALKSPAPSGEGPDVLTDVAFGHDFISGTTTHTAVFEVTADLQGDGAVPVRLVFQPAPSFAQALADGSVAVSASVDGQDVGDGLSFALDRGTPSRDVTVEVTKQGFGPGFSGEVGRLVASLESGADDAPRESAALSMGAGFGLMSALALLALAVLAFLAWRAWQAAAAKRAWAHLLANLDDDTVLVFDDDEVGARA